MGIRSYHKLVRIRAKKVAARGGFAKKILLKEVHDT